VCEVKVVEVAKKAVPKKKEFKVVLYSSQASPMAALRAVNRGSTSIRGTPMRIVDGVCILTESSDSTRPRSGPSMVAVCWSSVIPVYSLVTRRSLWCDSVAVTHCTNPLIISVVGIGTSLRQ
jgi:hypothetical protein